jgi:hypothetical protein
MQFLSGSGNDYVLLIGRCCLAVVFGISALSKFRREPAEIKVLANLHIPAPASAEVPERPPRFLGNRNTHFRQHPRRAGKKIWGEGG